MRGTASGSLESMRSMSVGDLSDLDDARKPHTGHEEEAQATATGHEKAQATATGHVED